MTGGPGAAAILDIPFLVDAGINRNRELIVMAQRGTLYDKPDLYCPELDHFYARQVSMVFDAPSTGAKQAAAARACHDRLGRRRTRPPPPPPQRGPPPPAPATPGWCAAAPSRPPTTRPKTPPTSPNCARPSGST